MTELLAANPKAKDDALTRKAIEQLGPSPVQPDTLRKRFGKLRRDSDLPPLVTAEDTEEQNIVAYFRAKEAARERDQIELELRVHEAFALGLDIAALSAQELDELQGELYSQWNRLAISLDSKSFLEKMPSADAAIAELKSRKELIKVLKKQLDAVQNTISVRRRLGLSL